MEAPAAPAADAAPAAAAAETAPKKRATRSRKKADPAPEASSEKSTEAPAAAEPAAAEPAPAADADASASAAPAEAPKASRGRSRRAASTAAEKSESAAGTDAKADTKNEAENEAKNEAKAEEQPESKNEAKTGDATGEEGAPAEAAPKKRNSRNRSKKPAAEAANDGEAKASTENEGDEKESGRNGSENRNGADKQGRGGDAQQRSSRTRQRERKRRGQGDDLEPEITEDDVLLPIAGILDVLDNYAFVRTSGYLPGTNDVYVSLGQVKKYGLRKGDSVVGAIRQPREGEGGGRQKYNAIVRVDTINSRPAEENQERVDFASFTPLHPSERLRLETEGGGATQRVIDLFAPIGKGQRGLVVGPRESGKSTALRRIAAAVSANQPDAHLMLVLIDERPEEVTELQRTINGEVIASTFDRTPEDHVTIAELAIERAKRLVELGHDVVVLLDSVTGLARAYNAHAPAGVRVPAGQLDATAIHPVKRLLSAARNIENGGSLTIIATASAQPGSTVDEALLGELEAVANSQLRLSGEAADRRVFPAVDLRASATRREELLTGESEAGVMNSLRRALAGSDREQALESVLKQIEGTSSNVEFLALTQRSQG
ncbi:transcription termination factor Rho [Leucobacter soli]|uniref:transcription termination factor Rho n=1 Tax=Leucobacter soli TaxID=2812850 RepID=UPI00361D5EA9